MIKLRKNTLIDIQNILNNYNHGKFDRIETAYLLIKLRPYNNNQIIWDIASFVAHDKREFGLTYKKSNNSIDKLLLLMSSIRQKGGLNNITRGDLLIEQNVFIGEIEKILRLLGVDFSFDKISYEFMSSVLENIAGSELIIKGLVNSSTLKAELSDLQSNELGIRTIYAKVTPPSNMLHKGDIKPQVTIGSGVSIGFPIFQAIPFGVVSDYDLFIYMDH